MSGRPGHGVTHSHTLTLEAMLSTIPFRPLRRGGLLDTVCSAVTVPARQAARVRLPESQAQERLLVPALPKRLLTEG